MIAAAPAAAAAKTETEPPERKRPRFTPTGQSSSLLTTRADIKSHILTSQPQEIDQLVHSFKNLTLNNLYERIIEDLKTKRAAYEKDRASEEKRTELLSAIKTFIIGFPWIRDLEILKQCQQLVPHCFVPHCIVRKEDFLEPGIEESQTHRPNYQRLHGKEHRITVFICSREKTDNALDKKCKKFIKKINAIRQKNRQEPLLFKFEIIPLPEKLPNKLPELPSHLSISPVARPPLKRIFINKEILAQILKPTQVSPDKKLSLGCGIFNKTKAPEEIYEFCVSAELTTKQWARLLYLIQSERIVLTKFSKNVKIPEWVNSKITIAVKRPEQTNHPKMNSKVIRG